MAESRILVVDDDRGNCAILSQMLRSLGYDVDVAYEGQSALKLAQTNSYTLALLDYQMPEMNGVELFERMRAIQPDVVGVFLTGHATINTVYPAIDVGIDRVLAKPVDFAELLPIIEQHVGRPDSSGTQDDSVVQR